MQVPPVTAGGREQAVHTANNFGAWEDRAPYDIKSLRWNLHPVAAKSIIMAGTRISATVAAANTKQQVLTGRSRTITAGTCTCTAALFRRYYHRCNKHQLPVAHNWISPAISGNNGFFALKLFHYRCRMLRDVLKRIALTMKMPQQILPCRHSLPPTNGLTNGQYILW